MSFFLYNLKNSKYSAITLITHTIPAVVLSELSVGVNSDSLKRKLNNFVNEIEINPKPGMNHLELLNAIEKQIFNNYKNCGMTLIHDEKPLWFSKVVYGV